MTDINFISWLVVIANYAMILFSAYQFVRISVMDFIDWYHEIGKPTSNEPGAISMGKALVPRDAKGSTPGRAGHYRDQTRIRSSIRPSGKISKCILR